MQHIMDCFSSACKAFGLTISIKKTKVMFTPPPGTEYYEPSIYVEGVRLGVVNTFPYLGSTMSRDGALDAEIHFRIGKASSSYACLQERVWSDRDLTNATKLSIYNTCVLKALLLLAKLGLLYVDISRFLRLFIISPYEESLKSSGRLSYQIQKFSALLNLAASSP